MTELLHDSTLGGQSTPMEYNDVRQQFVACPAFGGLDEPSRALLFLKGKERPVANGEVIYAEGDTLDNGFYLVLSGTLTVEKNDKEVATLTEGQIFGEMAFVETHGIRSATVRATSNTGSLLRFEITPAELSGPPFRPLRSYFKSEAWQRFVSNAQATADGDSEGR